MEGALTPVEFLVSIALERTGHKGEPETLLDGFLSVAAQRSPSIAEDLPARTIEVTFAVDADTADEAFEAARPIFAAGLRAAGIEPRPIVGVRVETLEHALTTEPQPA